MNKEELEKYTVDFMNNETSSNRSKLNSVMGKMLIRYAEIFQKRIAELEAQIEKMKCCGNCKNKNFDWILGSICGARDKMKVENPLNCKCEKWEIKEK